MHPALWMISMNKVLSVKLIFVQIKYITRPYFRY